MFPEGYSDYIKLCRKLEMSPNLLLVRFATRYKMAGQLQSIHLLLHSEIAQSVYLYAMRIAFAYSALESLEAFAGNKLVVKDVNLAKLLRSEKHKKCKDFFIDEADLKLKRVLEKMYESKNDTNIKPIYSALRHSMFHGQFNPTAAGFTTKTGLTLLAELEQKLFKAINEFGTIQFQGQIREMTK